MRQRLSRAGTRTGGRAPPPIPGGPRPRESVGAYRPSQNILSVGNANGRLPTGEGGGKSTSESPVGGEDAAKGKSGRLRMEAMPVQ
jgi:hypothetical protein